MARHWEFSNGWAQDLYWQTTYEDFTQADQDDAELGRQTQVEDVPLAADLGAGRGSGDTRRDSSGRNADQTQTRPQRAQTHAGQRAADYHDRAP